MTDHVLELAADAWNAEILGRAGDAIGVRDLLRAIVDEWGEGVLDVVRRMLRRKRELYPDDDRWMR